LTTLTGYVGLRPDSAVAARLADTAAAAHAVVQEGTAPDGGRWMIAVLPSTSGGHERHYAVAGRGARGFIVGRLFGDWSTGGTGAPDPLTLAAWLAEPDTLARRAWGRYTAAVVTDAGDLVLMRDPVGLAGCYHTPCEQGLAFSTRTESLVDILGVRPPVDWELIGSFLLQQHFPTTRTSLAGVSQLLPGHVLRLPAGTGATPQTTTSWSAVRLAQETATEDDPAALTQVLRRCVRAWTEGAPAVAVQLSGGLDSSTVTWAAREELGDDQQLLLRSLYHSGLNSADERRYAQAMADRVQAPLAFVDAAHVPVLGPAQRAARRWDCVSMHPAELRLSEALLDGLAPGVVALAGGGGDQVFMARAADSSQLADHLRARGLRAGLGEALAESRATGEPFAVLARTALRGSRLRRLAGQDGDSLGVRFATPPWLPPTFTPLPLALPAGLDALPVAKRQQLVGIAYWAGGVDRDHAPTGALVYPMLSQPLVEIALRTPTHRLVDHTDDRLPLRRAMRELLPPIVASRRVKSEYSGLYQWAVRQSYPYLRELLLDGAGVAAGLVDRCLVDADLTRTALGARGDPNWPLIGLIAAETWCRAWQEP
jgi:asparagine synthase (glutamine-hydrolysing)